MLFNDSKNIFTKIHAGKMRSVVLARENAQVLQVCKSEGRAMHQREPGVLEVTVQ